MVMKKQRSGEIGSEIAAKYGIIKRRRRNQHHGGSLRTLNTGAQLARAHHGVARQLGNQRVSSYGGARKHISGGENIAAAGIRNNHHQCGISTA